MLCVAGVAGLPDRQHAWLKTCTLPRCLKGLLHRCFGALGSLGGLPSSRCELMHEDFASRPCCH